MFYTTHSFDIDREPSSAKPQRREGSKVWVGPFVNFVKIRVHGGETICKMSRQISRREQRSR